MNKSNRHLFSLDVYLVKPFIGMEKFGDILWSGGKEPLVLKVLDALLGFLIEPVEKKQRRVLFN